MAAGKGERMQPLSFDKQKHVLKLVGKSILEHNLDQLDGLVDEVIIIIRKSKSCDAIKRLLGNKYKNLKIRYVYQRNLLGTGDAIKSALPFLEDNVLLLNGDDLYIKKDIKEVLSSFPCLLVKKVEQPQFFGVVETKGNKIVSFIEKPKTPKSNLANTGMYYLPTQIFKSKINKTKRGEYEVVDFVKKLIKKGNFYYVKATQWIPVSYPWSLLDANRELMIEKRYIAKNCKINCELGDYVSVGENSVINNCDINHSIIGKNCVINNCTIKNSIIGDYCKIEGPCDIKNTNGSTVFTEIKGKMVDTKRKRFGIVMGDRSILNPGCVIYPGVKIWPKKVIKKGQIVKKDVKN